MDWQMVAHEFVPDGSLRDIYILGTDISDWQQVLDALRRSPFHISYQLEGVAADLPGRAEEIFAEWAHDRRPMLRFEVGGVILVSHFFATDEIEFDLRPEEVTGPDRLDPLLGFMRMLGELTGKTVVLTPENRPQSPIFRFDPSSSHVEYVPAPA